ncbi:drimenol monooxygenase-like [Silene latifolia]|uniref:drimenol monooxygenase-like n=1 Tax=Silene latifolia TaxID=37657 RepID=UPI003D76BBDB
MEFYANYLNIILVLCFIGLVIYFLNTKTPRKSNTRKLPPSPSPTLPIFGNLFCVGRLLHRSLAELAKIHGPIMFLKLGQLPTVVFTSADVAKEALQKHDLMFSNKTVFDAAQASNHHENSLIFLPPIPKWRNLRKISNTHIFYARKLDASRYIRENKVKDLYSYVQNCANTGMVVDIGQAGFTVVLNVLSTTLISLDLGVPDSELSSSFRKTFRHILEELGKPNISDYFPILKKLDVQGIKRRTTIHLQKILNMFNDVIQERLRNRGVPNYVRCDDVLEALLDMKPNDAEYIEASAIPHLFLEYLIAGVDTISNTFEWAMAELIHNPSKLKTLQAELQKTVGKGNSVRECHITELPYLQAIVKETLRLHPPLPIPIPRKTDSDVNMSGYTIPKNVMVLFNVWAIGRDPTTWDKPDEFEPERFIGSEIDVKGHNFELIPFGSGRRICPGIPLAIRMIPLMLASLIHEFDWMLEDGVTPENMDMEEKYGLTFEKAQRLCVVPVSR